MGLQRQGKILLYDGHTISIIYSSPRHRVWTVTRSVMTSRLCSTGERLALFHGCHPRGQGPHNYPKWPANLTSCVVVLNNADSEDLRVWVPCLSLQRYAYFFRPSTVNYPVVRQNRPSRSPKADRQAVPRDSAGMRTSPRFDIAFTHPPGVQGVVITEGIHGIGPS
jgi:hypothetical protein